MYCTLCKEFLIAGVYHIDHKHAMADGGPDEFHNLQAICLNCHCIKTKRENLARRKFQRRSADAEERRDGGDGKDTYDATDMIFPDT